MKISDISHGLIVIEKIKVESYQLNDILHFVGYWAEPTSQDIESLYLELSEDTTFGLTQIIDRLSIINANVETLNFFKHQAKLNDNLNK